MTTEPNERDVLELVDDIRAKLKSTPNDTKGMDAVQRLAQEITGAPASRPITLSTWPEQPDPEPRSWLVNGWLPAGRVALLTGPGGVGKSRLVLQLAAGIASGGNNQEDTWIDAPRDVLKVGTAVAQEGSPVVYATWEDEPEEVWRRLSEISGDAAPWVTPDRLEQLHIADMAGHGPIWAPNGSRHISALATITEAGQHLRRHCEDLEARLLVLDPLAAAYAGDENARGLVRAFVADWDAWGRATNCAVLLVAHPPKSGALYAGSTDWQGAVRNMWSLDKDQRGRRPSRSQDDSRPFEWRLSCEKSNYGIKPEPLHLDWDTEGGGLRWKVAGLWEKESTTVHSANGSVNYAP